MENVQIINVHSTHFYLIEGARGKLLVDAGWSWAEFTAGFKQSKTGLNEVRFVMFTHHHMDHAGLVQNVKNASGATLLIHEIQIPFLLELNAYYESKQDRDFLPIQVTDKDIILGGDTRLALKDIGLSGEVIHTPGHSPDSVTLVLDSGLAFTGDLHLPNMVSEENVAGVKDCWQQILARGAQTIYPAHGPTYQAGAIQQMMIWGV